MAALGVGLVTGASYGVAAATAEEVAAAVVYLASAAAASITGQVLVLDGGLTAV